MSVDSALTTLTPTPWRPPEVRIGLALELPARVERGHDHLERRLARIFGVRVDRDAAAVVADGQAVAGLELDLDAAGVAGDRLVHAIVDDLGGEVVERAVVGAADVHAGAAADGLEPFEHLDRGGVVAVGRRRQRERRTGRPFAGGYRARVSSSAKLAAGTFSTALETANRNSKFSSRRALP